MQYSCLCRPGFIEKPPYAYSSISAIHSLKENKTKDVRFNFLQKYQFQSFEMRVALKFID